MLITFTGLKTGRRYTTPVRYLRSGGEIHCFTSFENKWWRNLREGAEVSLRISGVEVMCNAKAIADNPSVVATALANFLTAFPQDSPYYRIRLDRSKHPLPGELERAAADTVMVVANPLRQREHAA